MGPFLRLFIHFVAVLVLRFRPGFPLVLANSAYSLAAVCRLLIVVASLVVEHRPCASAVATARLLSTGSVVVVHGLSCPTACGSTHTMDQTCLLHWQENSLPLRHQGSPRFYFFLFN